MPGGGNGSAGCRNVGSAGNIGCAVGECECDSRGIVGGDCERR